MKILKIIVMLLVVSSCFKNNPLAISSAPVAPAKSAPNSDANVGSNSSQFKLIIVATSDMPTTAPKGQSLNLVDADPTATKTVVDGPADGGFGDVVSKLRIALALAGKYPNMQIRIVSNGYTELESTFLLPGNVQYINNPQIEAYKPDYLVNFSVSAESFLEPVTQSLYGVEPSNIVKVGEYGMDGTKDLRIMKTGLADGAGAWFLSPAEIAAIKPVDPTWAGFGEPSKGRSGKIVMQVPEEVKTAISSGEYFFGYSSPRQNEDVAKAAFINAAVSSLKPPIPKDIYFLFPTMYNNAPRLGETVAKQFLESGSNIQSIEYHSLKGTSYDQAEDEFERSITKIGDTGVKVHVVYGRLANGQVLQAMKHSKRALTLVTGDQSLTEALSFDDKLPVYQVLAHKKILMSQLQELPGPMGEWFRSAAFLDIPLKHGYTEDVVTGIKNAFIGIKHQMSALDATKQRALRDSLATLPLKFDASKILSSKLQELMIKREPVIRP